MPDFRTTREVATDLGVSETLIENTIRRREIARPLVVGHVRLWSAEEIEALREALAARARRRAARTRTVAAARVPLLDRDDLAVDLAAEYAHEDGEVRS